MSETQKSKTAESLRKWNLRKLIFCRLQAKRLGLAESYENSYGLFSSVFLWGFLKLEYKKYSQSLLQKAVEIAVDQFL